MGTYSGGSYWDSLRSTYAQDHTLGTERPTWARGLGASALTVMIQSSGILYGTAQACCGPAQAASLNLPSAEGRQMTPCNERIRVVYDQNIARTHCADQESTARAQATRGPSKAGRMGLTGHRADSQAGQLDPCTCVKVFSPVL